MASAATYAPTGFSYYVWWFPGSPVRVHLSLDVVRRLREQLQTTPAQGLLFGKTADGATEILDFQSSPGPIPESVSALGEDGGKPLLVGCYRTGDSLTLNDGDRALARTFFAQPYHVILVIQPAEVGPPTASFFFHDADGKMAECSLMEFPFEPSLLASEERDRLRRSQEAAARRSAALQPVESAEPARKTRSLRRLLPALLCAFTVLVALVAVGNRWWAERGAVRSTTGRAAAAPAQPLSVLVMGLRAKRQNGDVEIAWNHDSPVVAAATSGVLSIQDGPSRRDITLDGAQIRSSSVLYSPSSDTVSIQLAVTTPLSTVTESFLLLLPENRVPAPAVPGEAKGSAMRAVRLKPFTPPAVAAGSSPQPATPALPLVSLQPGGAVDPGSVSTLIAQSPLPAPPPESQANAAAPAPATYHMAEPRNRVVPQIPPALLSTLVLPATVQVRVSIDRNGRVTRAEGVPHRGVNAVLMDRLVTVSRLWTFTPARRGDEPMESEFVLEFRFGR